MAISPESSQLATQILGAGAPPPGLISPDDSSLASQLFMGGGPPPPLAPPSESSALASRILGGGRLDANTHPDDIRELAQQAMERISPSYARLAQNALTSMPDENVSRADVGPNMSPTPSETPRGPNMTPAEPEGPTSSPSLTPPSSSTTREPWQSAYDVAVKGEGGNNTGATNPKSGALGSFQLMPDQVKGLGYKPSEVKAMSYEEQRDKLFPEYLASHGIKPGDLKTPADVGVAIAAPAFLKASDDTVISENGKPWVKGTRQYDDNPAWDVNGDGAITRGDLARYYAKQGGAGAAAAKSPIASFLSAPVTVKPGGTETRVEQGTPYTPEDRASLAAAAMGEAQNVAGAYGPAFDAYLKQRDALLARSQQLQAREDAARAQAEQSRIGYSQSQDRVRAAVQAVNDDKAPQPFGGNTLAQILAVLGQALGAYGAARTGTPNFAMQLINSHLDRDLQAWKEKHLDLKFKVESEHQLSRDQFAQYQQDLAEHSQLLNQLTLNEAAQMANTTQDANARRELGTIVAGIQRRSQDSDLAMQRAARDKVTIATSAPITKAPGPEDVVKRTEELKQYGVPTEELEKSREEAGAPKRIPLNEKEQAVAKELGEKDRDIAGHMDTISKALELLNRQGDQPGTGFQAMFPELAQMGYGVASHLPGTDTAKLQAKAGEAGANYQLINQALTSATVATVGQGHVGIERSPEAIEKLKPSLWNTEAVREVLMRGQQNLEQQRRALRSGAPDAVRRYLDENGPVFEPPSRPGPAQ